jgi:NitT/TauT family transport system substrate-binding protein
MRMNRRHVLATSAALAASALLPARSFAGSPLRLTSVRSGSVGWLIETIKAEGLDKKYGVDLDVIEVASNAAAPVTLLAGEADVVVSDWTWALRQRSKGEDFKFAAYSSALGSLIVPKDSAIKTLADLEGKKVGVAGSSADKSWVLLRAYSRKTLGKDISKMCETVFGAAPLITEEFKSGRLDACLNFWTFAARLMGDGARQIVSVADVIKALEISPAPPLVGFIWSEKVAKEKSLPIEPLLSMVNDANDILAKSESAWDRLKPLVKPATDEEFAAIKAAFRAGITKPWSEADTQSAEKLTKLLIELGDTELVGDGTRFDPNLFHIKAG